MMAYGAGGGGCRFSSEPCPKGRYVTKVKTMEISSETLLEDEVLPFDVMSGDGGHLQNDR
jgi:hypothetical protein